MATVDPNVVALQKEINRFANDPDIGFAPICCDGLLGPNTFTALMYALTSINLSTPAQNTSSCPDQSGTWPPADVSAGDGCPAVADNAGSYISGISTDADIKGSIYGLTQTLQQGAQVMGFSYISCPPASACAPGSSVGITAKSPIAVKTYGGSGTFLGLPTWAAWTIGGVLALVGAMTLRDHLRSK